MDGPLSVKVTSRTPKHMPRLQSNGSGSSAGSPVRNVSTVSSDSNTNSNGSATSPDAVQSEARTKGDQQPGQLKHAHDASTNRVSTDCSSPSTRSTPSSKYSSTSLESSGPVAIAALERSVSSQPGVTHREYFLGDDDEKTTPMGRSFTTMDLLQHKPSKDMSLMHTRSERNIGIPASSATLEVESVILPLQGIKHVEIDKNTHTVFSVEVRLHGGLQWIIEKRYSDFRELHEKLKRTNAQVKHLHFPKRHVFRNRQQSVIEQRRSELERYINEVLEIRPLIRVPLFTFLEVYAHMESYERKIIRHQKELESERMKNLLSPDEIEDASSAFKRLCNSKYVYTGGASSKYLAAAHAQNNVTNLGSLASSVNNTSTITSPLKNGATKGHHGDAASPTSLSASVSVSRTSFRRDILGVFPDMPSSFAMRFIKALSDHQGTDITSDEFLRAMAILKRGSMEDQLRFVFNMCDLDHAGKVQSTGLSNFLVSVHGRAVLEKSEYRRILSEAFDHGRVRLSVDEFVRVIPEHQSTGILVSWMQPFVNILCESVDPALLESQEEFNPVVQQKILASETHFSLKEIAILQDAFNTYRISGGGDNVDLDALMNDFQLDISDDRFVRVFASSGNRANGVDIDVFSFVNALSIACRGTKEEKARFAFGLFTPVQKNSTAREEDAMGMTRDDLYAMLRIDVSQNSQLETKVSRFVQKDGVKPVRGQENLLALVDGTKTPTVSGSQLGLYVDHIMNDHASQSTGRLSLQGFTKWVLEEDYEMSALSIMREVAFVDLGLVPTSREEELSIANQLYRKFDPLQLVEDEAWFLMERKWFDHWCKYIRFPFHETFGTSTPSTTTTITATGTSSFSELTAKLATAAVVSAAAPPIKPAPKDPPIVDSEGNVIRPKCLNNYPLLVGTGSERRERPLRSSEEIKLGKHFIIICEQLWLALKSWYGGGPEIKRKVIFDSRGMPMVDIWGKDALKAAEEEEGGGEDSAAPKLGHHESKDDQLVAMQRRMRSGGSVGLTNLGNTCYMNSALQCLTNTQILAEYFLSRMYLSDINRTSTLGLQGKLAEVYGKLAEDMWCAKQKAISPRNFKKTIGRFNEAFRGNDQQDAQELLAFLLSGLSEDLNRIQNKPYVEQPDSDGRYDSDLADEWWRNHLRREVSIIVALFTGQYKSLLTCSVCGFKSARFEPFTFLQVPLPEPTHNTVTILLVLSNGMAPKKVSVRLGMTATVAELKQELALLCTQEFDQPMVTDTDIKICEYSGSMILSLKADNRRVAQIRSIDRLIAFQLETLDPEILKATRHRRPSNSVTTPGGLRMEELEVERNMQQQFCENIHKGALVEVKTRSQSLEYSPAVVVEIPTEESPGLVTVRLRFGEEDTVVSLNRVRPRQPRLLYVPLMFRKLSYSAVYYKNPFRPVPFGIPMLVRICPELITGYDLYQLVWHRFRRFLSESPPQEWDPEVVKHVDFVTSHIDDVFSGVGHAQSGFVLRRVENKGLTDSRSAWLKRSFGYTIACTKEALDLMEEETIAIDWDLRLLQNRDQLEKMKQIDTHSSIATNEAIDKGPVPLSHCLKSFTLEEKINEGYCSSCCEHHEMTKKMEIWRLPPVMVVHLKRFQYTQTYRRKLGSLVEFPIEGLDFMPCVAPQPEHQERYPMKKKTSTSTAPTEEPSEDDHQHEDEIDVGEPMEAVARQVAVEAKEAFNDAVIVEGEEPTEEISDVLGTERKSPCMPLVRNRTHRGYTNSNLDQSRALETHYDLYGVVNHQGALGGGHYTAYAKNFVDGQWYFYDDERVRLIEESKIVTSSAYLLFYLRTDMKNVMVHDMFPRNSDGPITEEDINRFVEESDERKCRVM